MDSSHHLGVYSQFWQIYYPESSEENGKLSGIKVIRCTPRVTHLMYDDDLVIYYKAK